MTWAALLTGTAPPPTLRGTIRRNRLTDDPEDWKRIQDSARRQRQRGDRLAYHKAYYLAHKAERIAYMKAWKKANPQIHNEYNQRWLARGDNYERMRKLKTEWQRAYRAKQREARNAAAS